MRSFQDSIEQMLWPEKRDKDPVLGDKVPGLIDRTTAPQLPPGARRLPPRLPAQPLVGSAAAALSGAASATAALEIGPIPKGTPVNLLANLEPALGSRSEPAERRHSTRSSGARAARQGQARPEATAAAPATTEARAIFANLVPDCCSKLSKCPDFVVNRGHYFGTGSSGTRYKESGEATSPG